MRKIDRRANIISRWETFDPMVITFDRKQRRKSIMILCAVARACSRAFCFRCNTIAAIASCPTSVNGGRLYGNRFLVFSDVLPP